MKRLLFIVNPISGGKNKEKVPRLIGSLLDNQKLSYDVRFTDYKGHATLLAQQAVQENYTACIAVGGDGTINEVAQGLVHSTVALGIIPMGSGNGLARHLKIPLQLEKAIAHLNSAKSLAIDTGLLNEQLFLCTCGLGFDAEIAHLFDQAPSRGLKTYAQLTLRAIRNFSSPTFRFTRKNQIQEVEALLFTGANASQWGNNFYISPGASVRDGMLNSSILQRFPWWYAPVLVYKLRKKKIHSSKYFSNFTFQQIDVQTSRPVWAHIDGEPYCLAQDFSIRVQPASLRIWT